MYRRSLKIPEANNLRETERNLKMVKAVALMLSLFIMASCAPSGPTEASVPIGSQLPAITNADGVTLRVGMSRAEFEEFYGRTIENGWIINYPDEKINFLSVDDTIVYISTAGFNWSMDNGVEPGMPIERVRELLGEEDRITPEDPENQYPAHDLVYEFEDGSFLSIRYFNNDVSGDGPMGRANTVFTFALYSSFYLREPDEREKLVFGTISDDNSGEGNASVDLSYTTPDAIYDITHESSIKVFFIEYLTDTEYEVYSAEGAGANQTELLPKLEGETINGSLRIETEGTWRVVVKLP